MVAEGTLEGQYICGEVSASERGLFVHRYWIMAAWTAASSISGPRRSPTALVSSPAASLPMVRYNIIFQHVSHLFSAE